MADSASAFAATIKAEGGYINAPQYPGGETCKGNVWVTRTLVAV